MPDNSLSCTNENLFVKNNVPINGKLDLDVKQGSKTPDCDLLALLLSMKEKPEGKNYLESLLTYDKDSNQLSVNLAGVNKSYTFTQEEISKYDSLSTGDGDIRAIELALAKHIYDSDKSDKKAEFNPSKILNGLFAHQSFNLLKGERPISKYETTDNLVDDFGNPNKFFQLSFYKQTEHPETDELMVENYIALSTNKHIYHPIFYNHSYSVINSDKDFIYLRNPHDSSDILKVKRGIIKDYNANIQCSCFQQDK